MDEQFVVDLKRHNDGEDGLVGPFSSRRKAEDYIDKIEDRHVRKWAIVRPIEAPLVRELMAEVGRLRWQVKHGGDHMCDECWPE